MVYMVRYRHERSELTSPAEPSIGRLEQEDHPQVQGWLVLPSKRALLRQ